MIAAHLDELTSATSVKQACALLGASRATRYRRRQPPRLGPPPARATPPNALTEAERQHILTVLRSPQYCDLAPAQVWARLLDEGIYLLDLHDVPAAGRRWGEPGAAPPAHPPGAQET